MGRGAAVDVSAKIVPVWPKIDQFLEVVWAWGFEYAGNQLVFSMPCRQAHKFYRTDKVSALRIRLFDNQLGEVEFAFQSQSLLGHTAHDRTAIGSKGFGGGLCMVCLDCGGARL